MGAIVGIDLGTTNSCVAVLQNGEAVVIHNEIGSRTTPSVVAQGRSGEILVGAPAKRQAVLNPQGTVFGIKRLIGRRYDSDEVEALRRTMPYPIVRGGGGDAWVRLGERELSPQEVSAHVLAAMRRVAEQYLGEPVTDAVVTVPAYFDDAQRQATKDAGEIAGLRVRAILNEPTAAALAYGVHRQQGRRTVAVFDLGGGTFDVSIVRQEEGVFEVLATAGDTALGGDDFDRLVVEELARKFREEHGIDVLEQPEALQRLKEAGEKAKQELSSAVTTEVNLPFFAVGADGPLHLRRDVTRAMLESLVGPLLERLEEPCRRALADARLDPEAIDEVLLVGGMTRMPAVEEKAASIFGKRPLKGVNPDEVVAVGAATHSAVLRGQLQEVVLLDVTSHSLGIRVEGDRFSPIIRRNTPVPTKESKVFATTEDDQEFVSIEVFQGEEPVASRNRCLGEFVLGDLPRGPRGQIHVEVSFLLDADGILHVQATETRSGKATSQKIVASSRLGRDDVARLARAFGSMPSAPA